MNEETQSKDQIAELTNLQPLAVIFLGKERVIHHFHQGTAERFNRVLETASEGQSMKTRHKQQTKMLAIILSDLQGSSKLFRGLRRWLWEKSLSFTNYSEVEALKLIEAAVLRIQNYKLLELHTMLIVAQIMNEIKAIDKGIINEIRKEANNE